MPQTVHRFGLRPPATTPHPVSCFLNESTRTTETSLGESYRGVQHILAEDGTCQPGRGGHDNVV